MSKTITKNQILGEIGEASVKKRFLSMGFQFDGRSRLEAGIDGIAEVMDRGKPLAKMIAVQVKATDTGRYVSEDEDRFSYTIRENDLAYWRGSNLPIILVLYRQEDESYYWKSVEAGIGLGGRKIQFDKATDTLDKNAVDRLAALTVPKAGFGYYVPPLGGGEDALVNILPVNLPQEVFVSSAPYDTKRAAAILLDSDENARFDWVIKGGSFWSFHDPRKSVCRNIVDLDQVEAIETKLLAFHDDVDEQNNFAFLLRKSLQHQVEKDLGWNKNRKLFYFRASEANISRTFYYESIKRKTEAEVVNVSRNKEDETRIEFVRHHAFAPRFELIADQWFLVVSPTYYFTTNGFVPHSYPGALLSGKKRLDNSASLRGQVIMWHRFLTNSPDQSADLFETIKTSETLISFGNPPKISLPTKVPEDVWGTPKKKIETAQEEMAF